MLLNFTNVAIQLTHGYAYNLQISGLLGNARQGRDIFPLASFYKIVTWVNIKVRTFCCSFGFSTLSQFNVVPST